MGYAQLDSEQLIQLLGKLFSSASLWLGPGGFEPPNSDLGKGQRSDHWASGPTVLLAETA